VKKVKELKKEKEDLEKQINDNDHFSEELQLKIEEAKKDSLNFQRELEQVKAQLEQELKSVKKQQIFKTQ